MHGIASSFISGAINNVWDSRALCGEELQRCSRPAVPFGTDSPTQHPVCQTGPGLQLNTVLRESGSSCTSTLEKPPPSLPTTSGDPLTYSPTPYWSSRRCKRLLRSSFIFYHSQEKCQNVWQKNNFVSDIMGSAATAWDAGMPRPCVKPGENLERSQIQLGSWPCKSASRVIKLRNAFLRPSDL